MKSLRLGFSLLPLLLLACGSSNGSGGSSVNGACGTTGTGTVIVTVSGLPSGVNGSVNLTPQGGTAQTVTSTTTLKNQKSGNYTITADIVTQSDPIVRTAYKATLSVTTTQVCDGETANIDVTYAQIPTSNKLWWGNENGANATLGYSSSHLAATGSPAGDVEAATQGALPGAFDHDGNLWVIDGTEESIKEYLAGQFSSGGAKTPDVVISSDAFTGGIPGPASLAFDPKGNLFVGITFSKAIVEFDHEHLAATASLSPDTTISSLPDAPSALAFDSDNNLWVASANDRVLKLSNVHNPGTSTASPDLTIEAQTSGAVVGDLTAPLGLAFDGSKNLWVNYNGTMASISPAQQGGTGQVTITPATQITADVLSLPAGIAFDGAGGLWFAYSAGKFAEFSAAQLGASSASLPPAVVITSSSVGSATSPAFYPAPAGLPLYSALPATP